MGEEDQSYSRKEKVPVSDAMYDALNSPAIREHFGTNDINIIVQKALRNYLKKEFNIDV